MRTANNKTITLENIGPIEKLTIPLPEAGVVVLRGRNGVGKSHALAAVDSLASGRGRPPCRDGATRGLVEGFGARLTIGRSTRRTGEAEVLTLEGRLDISQLVDPGLKDGESADRTRIKALIQLSGQPADAKLFEKILPEGVELGELVPPSAQADDPVQLAGQLKRALESEARRHEKTAEEARTEYAVIEREIRVDGDPGDDEDALWFRIQRQPDVVRAEAEQEVAEALASLRQLEARQEMAAQMAQQIAQAKHQLTALEAEQTSPEKLDAELADVESQIRLLEQTLAAAKERRNQLLRQRQEALQRQQRIAELRKTAEQTIPVVTDAELAEARNRLETARRRLAETVKLIQQAGLVRRLEVSRSRLAEAAGRAEVFRDAARAVEDALSELVGKVTRRLRVEGGRLVCDTHRGVEPFGELSPGERWRIALEIAAEQLGPGGLVTVPQEAWESLDPIHRAEAAQIARQVGVVLLTAEASGEEEITVQVE